MTRLLHITDLHAGPPFKPHLADAVVAAAAKLSPNAVAVSGDLVEFGESTSAWRDAAAFLARFQVPLAVVPGNHDIPRAAMWQRLSDPFANFRRFVRDRVDDVVQIPGATLVCLATPKRWTINLGYVSPEQLEWVRDQVEAAPHDSLRVVVMHHGLSQQGLLLRDRVRGAKLATWAFADMGIDLVLTGHNHAPTLEVLGHGRGFLWAQGGTATTGRYRGLRHRSQYIQEINATADTLTVTWWGYDRASREFTPQTVHAYERATLSNKSA